MRDSTDATIAKLESLRKRPLTEMEIAEIQLYENGKSLQQVQSFPGYAVILEMLSGYNKRAVDNLVTTEPGDEKKILGLHAVAFACSQILVDFQNDVREAVEASANEPSAFLEHVSRGRAVNIL